MSSFHRLLGIGIFVCAFLASCWAWAESEPVAVDSPGARLKVDFRLDERNAPVLEVAVGAKPIANARLGLQFKEGGPLGANFRIVNSVRSSRDEPYAIPVGKASAARNHYNELVVTLEEAAEPRRKLEIAIRVFDDGIAFRYVIPQQVGLVDFVLTDELTRVTFVGDPTTRALPLKNYTTSYENYYESPRVSEIGPDRLFGMPILLKSDATGAASPTWMAVTEANLTDYAGMYLSGVRGEPGTLASKLSPLPGRNDGAKVIGKAPHASPWRIVMIGNDPGRLLESNLIFNLSGPPAIKDTSWIKPGKTTFPWWNGYVLEGVTFQPGVNTATMKHYIDFCAEQGIPYHSLDGLDIAWYGGPIAPNGPTDVTRAAPSIDMPDLLAYAKQKGVRLRLWMHWLALKPQIDEAFAVYENWGIEGVMVDFMDRDDQEMVRFYHEMAEKAAKHHLTVTLHGAYKPTGMERTWPNVLSYEAALNQEYNKWSQNDSRGTPPSHNLDIAFVRMLAGPLDYHQGGMRSVLPENYHPRNEAPFVQGTRGHQLAMYVIYQNHLPMMADYPAAYRGQPGLEFIDEVPTNWDEIRVLNADPGRSLVIARRKGDAWYLGGMTGTQGRDLALSLDFLGDGVYDAKLYLDDPSGGPNAITRRTEKRSKGQALHVGMPPNGGFAARLTSSRN